MRKITVTPENPLIPLKDVRDGFWEVPQYGYIIAVYGDHAVILNPVGAAMDAYVTIRDVSTIFVRRIPEGSTITIEV